MKYFPSNLKHLRLSRGINQTQMIDLLNIEPTTWSNYERGKSYPKLELFHKISKYFQVPEDDLLNRDLAHVHLTEKKVEKKESKNVLLNVNPSVHLNPKNYEENDFASEIAEAEAEMALSAQEVRDLYVKLANSHLHNIGQINKLWQAIEEIRGKIL